MHCGIDNQYYDGTLLINKKIENEVLGQLAKLYKVINENDVTEQEQQMLEQERKEHQHHDFEIVDKPKDELAS